MNEKKDHSEGVERQDDGNIDASGVSRFLVHVLKQKLNYFENASDKKLNLKKWKSQ